MSILSHNQKLARELSTTLPLDFSKHNAVMLKANTAFDLWKLGGSDARFKEFTGHYERNIVTAPHEESDDRTSFTGGTVQDTRNLITGEFSLKAFHDAQSQIKKQIGKLETSFENYARKRVRSLSEHDGDYNHDRRFDARYFETTRASQTGIAPTIELDCGMLFSAGVPASDIAKYGAMVYAIVKTLENNGILCAINVFCNQQSQVNATKQEIKIRIKEKDEYLDDKLLARVFTSLFYRRIMFTIMSFSDAYWGLDFGVGLGRPVREEPTATKGKLRISPSFVEKYSVDHKALLEFIKAAL